MATSKFKRMLNRELSHFSDSKSGSLVSEYIYRTFLGELIKTRWTPGNARTFSVLVCLCCLARALFAR